MNNTNGPLHEILRDLTATIKPKQMYVVQTYFNLSSLSCPAVPATIKTAPANSPAKVSDDVTITCVAEGNLPITLTWFNGSRQMSDNSRVTITVKEEKEYYRVNSTLVVERLVLQDTRQYSCMVTNQYGSDTKTFQIIAQRKNLLGMLLLHTILSDECEDNLISSLSTEQGQIGISCYKIELRFPSYLACFER